MSPQGAVQVFFALAEVCPGGIVRLGRESMKKGSLKVEGHRPSCAKLMEGQQACIRRALLRLDAREQVVADSCLRLTFLLNAWIITG